MHHNHPLGQRLFRSHPINRRLTENEVEDAQEMFLYNPSTSDLKRFVEDKYGKRLSTLDIANIRRKVVPSQLSMFPVLFFIK
jgi:hypothetical protein